MCTQARIAAAARVALATAAALTAAAALAAGAQAGEYHVYSCRTPTGQPAPTEGWSAPEHSGEDTTADTCEEADGGLVAGLNAHVRLTPRRDSTKPPGLSKHLTVRRSWRATLWRAGETVAWWIKPETAYTFWLTRSCGFRSVKPKSSKNAESKMPSRRQFR